MNLADARRHQAHLCDVHDQDSDHIGVIQMIRRDGSAAYVAGHPEHGRKWVPLNNLGTSCRIPD